MKLVTPNEKQHAPIIRDTQNVGKGADAMHVDDTAILMQHVLYVQDP